MYKLKYPPPKIGEEIYVDDRPILDRDRIPREDIRLKGGKGKVESVDYFSGGCWGNSFWVVFVEEHSDGKQGYGFRWLPLARKQEKLRLRFGEERAAIIKT